MKLESTELKLKFFHDVRSEMFEKLYDAAIPQLRYEARMVAILKLNHIVNPSLQNISNAIFDELNKNPLTFN